MKRKVSVITPLYKGKEYIPGLMKMMRNNAARVSMEYILVNDSPEDFLLNEENLVNEYDLSEKMQFRAVNNPKNLGIQGARLAGLLQAQGEYILFLDQDDAIEDNAVEILLAAITDSGADVAVGNGYRCYLAENGQCERKVPIYKKRAALKEVEKEKMYLYGTDMIFSPGQCLIRKDAIPEEWRIRRLAVNGCDDFLLWLLMFQNGCRFQGVWDKVYVHNETSRNYSASYEAMERSFMSMCDFLEQTKGYDLTKTAVLRRRYGFKTLLKSKCALIQKIKGICQNIDIIVSVISYKWKGYY